MYRFFHTPQWRGAAGGFRGLSPPSGRVCPPPSGNLGIFVGGDLTVCAANVRVQSSSVAFTVQLPQRYEHTGLLTKHPWMDLETSRPCNSSTIHTAARFRHCCIQLSMKRWCQLNIARVAHNAHPALSSYQNKCCNPTGRSHRSSDICYEA